MITMMIIPNKLKYYWLNMRINIKMIIKLTEIVFNN